MTLPIPIEPRDEWERERFALLIHLLLLVAVCLINHTAYMDERDDYVDPPEPLSLVKEVTIMGAVMFLWAAIVIGGLVVALNRAVISW